MGNKSKIKALEAELDLLRERVENLEYRGTKDNTYPDIGPWPNSPSPIPFPPCTPSPFTAPTTVPITWRPPYWHHDTWISSTDVTGESYTFYG